MTFRLLVYYNIITRSYEPIETTDKNHILVFSTSGSDGKDNISAIKYLPILICFYTIVKESFLAADINAIFHTAMNIQKTICKRGYSTLTDLSDNIPENNS